MIDSRTPLTPGWWLMKLGRELIERRSRYNRMQAYLDNEVELSAFAFAKSTSAAYKRLRDLSRTNFAELVVEAARERMRPVAFRTGAAGSKAGDEVAWRIWQNNKLDAHSSIVHRLALGLGDSYVIVGPRNDITGVPLITAEDPREVIAERDPTNPFRTMAALKLYRDKYLGVDVAWLYLPGRVYRARRKHVGDLVVQGIFDTEWTFDGDEGGPLYTSLPNQVVPVVRFVNKPDLRSVGMAEFENHTWLLDRINYQVLQRLEIATLQAFKQRAIKGVPNEDEEGKPIDYSDLFVADPGAMWLLPEAAEMWESGQVDLSPVRQAIRDDVQDLAAVTRTPLYYLSPDANQGSAEGASLAREGLVYRVEDRITLMSEAWEEVMRLAFIMDGKPELAAYGDTEVLWAPVERFSLAERYDAATKAVAAGVPWRTIMRHILQFSPQDVDRMDAERLQDALTAGLAAPLAPAAPAEATAEPATLANGLTAAEMKSATDSLGGLIRSGVAPESAAAQVGLEGLEFTGAVPVALRLPVVEAEGLEGGA